MKIEFKHKGDFSKTNKYFDRVKNAAKTNIFEKYGKRGVQALSSETPNDSGKTANSWYYEINQSKEATVISFYNSNINKGVPIAIILQYGHGTGTGGWVEGRDYINPAIQPIFDQMAEEIWKEVTKL